MPDNVFFSAFNTAVDCLSIRGMPAFTHKKNENVLVEMNPPTTRLRRLPPPLPPPAPFPPRAPSPSHRLLSASPLLYIHRGRLLFTLPVCLYVSSACFLRPLCCIHIPWFTIRRGFAVRRRKVGNMNRRMKLEAAAAVLGVAVDADPETLKAAYRRLALRWHPDKCKEADAKERFQEVRMRARFWPCLVLPCPVFRASR